MKIYFAGSIRGGRGDKELYLDMIKHLQTFGTVLTEHVGDPNLVQFGEDQVDDVYIHDRDVGWVKEADVIIAEVTTTSLGVGYEIGRIVEMGKPILCLYRPQQGIRLSGMINGCKEVTIVHYQTLEEAKKAIDDFLKGLQ